MRACIDETERRRAKQLAYNAQYQIEPQTIIKSLPEDLRKIYGIEPEDSALMAEGKQLDSLEAAGVKNVEELDKLIRKKTKEMKKIGFQSGLRTQPGEANGSASRFRFRTLQLLSSNWRNYQKCSRFDNEVR